MCLVLDLRGVEPTANFRSESISVIIDRGELVKVAMGQISRASYNLPYKMSKKGLLEKKIGGFLVFSSPSLIIDHPEKSNSELPTTLDD
jgi:hypothetical protein